MSYPVVVSAYAAFLEKLDYLSETDLARVEEAFDFAARAHSGQFRSSGDPYITHPIAVAEICATWKLDAQALMAALMHDAMEDCGITRDDIAQQFDETVAELVDGLTKLDKLQFNSREENQAESYRKMLLAMARDVRVILVKLADRTHNMRTMSDMPRNKWGRISTETMEIHVPIANRLGINKVYRELQDLAFKHLKPWRHDTLVKAVSRSRNRRKEVVQKIHAEVDAAFSKSGIKIRISNQEKTLYSIYRKMNSKRLSFAQVTDSYAVRIVVPHRIDCYTALGVLHQVFRPVPSKFRDYIANPKSNGYQSLHTTLVGPSGVSMNFHIRTEDMNLVDEYGVLTHWMVQAQPNLKSEQLGNKWVQSLLDIEDETRDAHEFWDNVRVDLFPDSVYVFTPKNQMLTLPRGATVLDFAYAIHSNVGEHTASVRINHEQVPLSTVLKSGDIVEVTTSPEAAPLPSWLTIVHTGRARSKIRNYLKTQNQNETVALGERMLQQALRAEGISQLPDDPSAWEALLARLNTRTKAELFNDISQGKRIAAFTATQVVEWMSEQGLRPDAVLLSQERYKNSAVTPSSAIILDGNNGAAVSYAKCCRPVPSDKIAGYLDRSAGLIVHNADCAICKKLLSKDAERFVSVEWADEPKGEFETAVAVTITNGKGVLGKIANELAALGSDITHITMSDEVALDTTELKFVLTTKDRNHIEHLLRQLAKQPYIARAQRILPTTA